MSDIRKSVIDVNSRIHPDDQMYSGNIEVYLSVGVDALAKIKTILAINSDKPKSILDLGCGGGRVTRHLRAEFPEAIIVASDLIPHCMDFCQTEFGATPHPAARNFDEIKFDGEGFDLIWSGSLMTHITELSAIKMIDLMVRSLAPNGVAIWTTHGRHVDHIYRSGRWPYLLSSESFGEIVGEYREGRYSFASYDHMKGSGYGISMTPTSWIIKQLQMIDSIRIVSIIERGWGGHQDIVAIRKESIIK